MKKGKYEIKELKKLQQLSDNEQAHSLADDLLCELLIELGYKSVIDEYVKITRWCG